MGWREACDTLPAGFAARSLGWGIAAWMIQNMVQPNGESAGRAFTPTPRQTRFLTWLYALDENGEFQYDHAARRLAKGSGKSPFAAAIALAELCGPVRFGGWDESLPGGVLGVPASMPWVQVVATSERQTQNTIRMVRAFAAKGTRFQRKFGLVSKKTFLETPGGGLLQQVTSSAHTLEGGEVSAAICDETEHWLPALGGPEVMETVIQNAAKVPGSRVIETSNAWLPGEGSSAERTWARFELQEEGQLRESRLLYDAIWARPNAQFIDDVKPGQIGVTEELKRVYEDCPWVDVTQIRSQIWNPSYPESRSRRFFFNQPTVSEDQWISAEEWGALRGPRELQAGEPIVAFFDGSRYDDHTALVGCSLLDGYVFVLGHFPPTGPRHVVDQAAVCEAVDAMFRRFDVFQFGCDVREWENYVVTVWPEKYGDRVHQAASRAGRFAWDMRTRYREFAEAVEAARTEIVTGAFRHDGDVELAKHVQNCRQHEYRGRVSINKDRPGSPRKIDLAVCMVGARMLYRQVVNSREWLERNRVHEGWR